MTLAHEEHLHIQSRQKYIDSKLKINVQIFKHKLKFKITFVGNNGRLNEAF